MLSTMLCSAFLSSFSELFLCESEVSAAMFSVAKVKRQLQLRQGEIN
ncbi:hypothetical protein ACQKNC_12070 [Lysinibacillus sp. NPDC094177]